jgi:hypothetical protein
MAVQLVIQSTLDSRLAGLTDSLADGGATAEPSSNKLRSGGAEDTMAG